MRAFFITEYFKYLFTYSIEFLKLISIIKDLINYKFIVE